MIAEELQSHIYAADRELTNSNYDESERLARLVLSMTDPTVTDDTVYHAQALNTLGNIELRRGNYNQALEKQTQAFDLCESVADRAGMFRSAGNIGIVHVYRSDYAKALQHYDIALSYAEELEDESGTAWLLGAIGNAHAQLSNYAKALEYYERALHIDENRADRGAVARCLGNIGNVHGSLSDFEKALEYFNRALSIAEELGYKVGVVTHLGNIGITYLYLSDYTSALECLSKALGVAEEIGNKALIANNLGDVGSVYYHLQEFEKAMEYYHRALHAQEELGRKSQAAEARLRLGGLFANTNWLGRNEQKAEEYLRESIAVSDELGTKKFEAHKILADLYESQGRLAKALEHLKKYHQLKDDVQSEEAKKSAQQMEIRRQLAEQEKEVAIAKASAAATMSATTTLLYKVLPESVATRMINGDEEIADYYPQVSILFADIAGFTPISADMPAIIVVRFLNYVFAEFDRIIKKYGCEKIKTIGDGYMAVAGAPIECADHAERLAAAALEMQETITLPESIREYMPSDVKLGVRIGLHTGSVVAGVIGEERFVYDIYSDAVNTAARMEGHGEENKIHVSNDFFRHLQNRFAMTKNITHGFVFEKRGEMEIKGKGLMRTYFLERAHS